MVLVSRDVALVRETIDELRERGDSERAAAVESALAAALAGALPADDYLTPAQAGKLFGAPVQTVREWVAAGRLDGVGRGRQLLFRQGALLSHLDSGRAGGGDPPWLVDAGVADRLARIASRPETAEASARFSALQEKRDAGERLTRAERAEMVRLARETSALASDHLERLITTREP